MPQTLSNSDKTADDDMQTAVKPDTLSMTGSSSVASEVEPSKAAERKISGASDDSIIDQWRRSIVVNDVSEEIRNMLIMSLEVVKRGGGKIESHSYHDESSKVLVTFSDYAGN